MRLSQNIAGLRHAAGWSQEELAARLDVTRQSVSKWESGQSVPDAERLVKLSELFGVSVDFLLKGDGPPAGDAPPAASAARLVTAGEAADYLAGAARPRQEGQICREIDWFLASYHPTPKAFIAYDREALAGRENPELRVTFDTNLRWRDSDLDLRRGDHGELLLPREQILMEIKIPGAAPVWLGHLLSELEVYPTSFSKYGTCYRQHLLGRETAPSPSKKEVPFCA